jgi:hypothetical protein
MVISSKKSHKEHEEWVRKIAREEALKCIQEVLSQEATFALRWLHDNEDKQKQTKKRQSK